MKLIFALMVLSSTAYANPQVLPEVGHLMQEVCIKGTTYYYWRQDRSGSLTPAVVDGKNVPCTADSKQECSKSGWDGKITCDSKNKF